MTLKAIVHSEDSGGYWAEVPALPGCFTQGETLEELEKNIQEAVELWLLAGEPDETTDQILETFVESMLVRPTPAIANAMVWPLSLKTVVSYFNRDSKPQIARPRKPFYSRGSVTNPRSQFDCS